MTEGLHIRKLLTRCRTHPEWKTDPDKVLTNEGDKLVDEIEGRMPIKKPQPRPIIRPRGEGIER